MAVQLGEFRKAARSLSKALKIAPTYAEAHDYLGRLQCEAGRSSQGVEHLRLALDLDPTLLSAYFDIARHCALRGDFEGYEKTLADFKAMSTSDTVAAFLIELRICGWRHDYDRIKEIAESLKGSSLDRFVRLLGQMSTFCWDCLGEVRNALPEPKRDIAMRSFGVK